MLFESSHRDLTNPLRDHLLDPVRDPNDAFGISAKEILKANRIDLPGVTFLSTQTAENAYAALSSGKVHATMLPPPYAEDAQAKGFNRLAEARDYAPLSQIGLVGSMSYLHKNPFQVEAVLRSVLKTMAYIRDPKNRSEVVQYITSFHKIDGSLADKAFTSILLSYSKDGTKPHQDIQREIEIYREHLKIGQTFSPEAFEDMSHLKRVQESLRTSGR